MFDHQKIDATKDDCILRLSYAPPSGTMTKIVCTIGPASDNQANINELVKHGMNVARLNFSHAGSDYTYPEECIAKIRAAPDPLHELLLAGATSSSEDGSLIKNFTANNVRAILVDTKGPEIRTGPLPGNADVAHIQAGHRVDLTLASVADLPAYIPENDNNSSSSSSSSSSNKPGQHLQLQVDYEKIAESLHVGKQVLLDDGLIALQVVAIDIPDKLVICQALNGGPIKKNKGVNLPGTTLDLPALTDKDKRDLKWACQVGADFVAASFM
jgi:pyruvate kinase